MKTRNRNIEALRVAMMLLIIMLHLTGELWNIPAARSQENDFCSSLLIASRTLFLLGVNTFAFISGYYGIINRGG